MRPSENPKNFLSTGAIKMWWPILLLFSTSAFSQVDVSAIKKLDEELPTFEEYKESEEEINIARQDRKFVPPVKVIPLEDIQRSGTQMGSLKPGAPIQNLENDKNYKVAKQIYIRFFNLEDENGFKYIQNKDGTVSWRILSRFVVPIKEELSLYEPPLKYTPAPDNIVRAEYDKKLSIPPEITFLAGLVQGDFMQDLFNDTRARSGISNQYGVHFFTQWKLPIKAGGVFHYEKSTYKLSGGDQIIYSAPSFGPQFKTKDFELFATPVRFQTQFRVSPFARAASKEVTYKFNSADLLASLERPYKNRWGEFVLGLYYQAQWLNLKDQSSAVQVQATNETNKSFGISFAQVFE